MTHTDTVHVNGDSMKTYLFSIKNTQNVQFFLFLCYKLSQLGIIWSCDEYTLYAACYFYLNSL